jgi:hypothetical protein
VEQFSELVDQLLSYESDANPLYYAMRFVDGLRDDIKQMVMIQRPSMLDSACALALVHEEAVELVKEPRRYEPFSNRQAHRSRHTSSLSTLFKLDRPTSSSVADDRRFTEAAGAPAPDDKVRALRRWRQARGLCEKCAQKWAFGHKCSQTVQLNALQEILDLFYDEESPTSGTLSPETEDSSQLYLCLSEAAVSEKEVAMSMKMLGRIQDLDIMILLDSGSSHTFRTATVAAALSGVSLLQPSLSVQVANGARLNCSQQIKNAEWHI